MIYRPDLEQENSYYRKALQHPTVGEIGRKYLESRGINEETINAWEIGWSPYGCVPPNYDKNDKEFTPYAKHWGRITFPIRDQNGNMVSISGRLVLQLKKPKYDHYGFPSRKVLFGLYQNKEEIRKEDRGIITEGQIDVISSWQQGVRIVTSSFGAHGSLDHLALLSRYSSRVDILYDEDNAGKLGTDAIKNFPTWGDLDIRLQKGVFPQGEDLDSWIKKHSKHELFELLDRSVTEDLKRKIEFLKRKG